MTRTRNRSLRCLGRVCLILWSVSASFCTCCFCLLPLRWWLHESQAQTSLVFTAGNTFCAFLPCCVSNECDNSKACLDTALPTCAVQDEDAETKLLSTHKQSLART